MKTIKILTAAALTAMLASAFMGCSSDGGDSPALPPPHVHTYSDSWTYDENQHWQEATCEHVELKRAEGAHTEDNGEITSHKNCESSGEITYKCTVCGKILRTEEIPAGHVFSSEWSKNETHHWHKATCEHSDLVNDKAEHNFVNGKCECGYIDGIDLLKVTTTSSADFGPSITLLVQRTEMTQEIYTAVMGENPSTFTYAANLPVNNVSSIDIIYFCNKLSCMNGLEPVYAVDGEKDVTKWGYTPHKGDYLRNHNTITADENANGYRVPTYDEFKNITGYSGSGMIKGNKEAWSEAHVWSSANSDGKTHPVATKEANEYGLYDLLGNVKELCWTTSRDVSNKNSCYPKYHGASYEDASEPYAGISSNGSPYYKNYDMYGFRVARNCN